MDGEKMETKKARKPRPITLPEPKARDLFIARLMYETAHGTQASGAFSPVWPKNAPDLARIAAYLIRQAKRHNSAAVALCNGWIDSEKYDRKAEAIEARIMAALVDLGPHWGAVFSGDPRGATVKLKCPSGLTDDWGGEGLCVPIR